MSLSKPSQAKYSFDFEPSHMNVKPICIKCNVLLVDSDLATLAILSKMLHLYGYTVSTTRTAADALSLARKRKTGYQVVLTDVDLPDMEGYEFIEKMNQFSKSPFVIMSANGDHQAKYNGLVKGAKLYLVKPVSMNDLKFLWQIAYRKFDNDQYPDECIDFEEVRNCNGGSPPKNIALDEDVESRVSVNEATNQQRAKREHQRDMGADSDDDREEGNDDSTAPKRPKLIWTSELHNMFLLTIGMLGNDAAQPRAIQQLMNVPRPTRENVTSHLQRHRLSLQTEQDAMKEKTMSMERPSTELGIGINPRRDLPGFVENTPLLNENMYLSNVGNFDFGGATESPNLLTNFTEQLEQEQQPQIWLPPLEEDNGDQDNNFGAEGDGVDELFKTENGSTRVVFRDEDLDDFFY